MNTKRGMELSYTEQQAVIGALLSIGEPDLAARLGRCMMAHRSPHHGDGRRSPVNRPHACGADGR